MPSRALRLLNQSSQYPTYHIRRKTTNALAGITTRSPLLLPPILHYEKNNKCPRGHYDRPFSVRGKNQFSSEKNNKCPRGHYDSPPVDQAADNHTKLRGEKQQMPSRALRHFTALWRAIITSVRKTTNALAGITTLKPSPLSQSSHLEKNNKCPRGHYDSHGGPSCRHSTQP